jgi:hypothetical protein
MMQLRLWHTYLGFFIAPSVIFFALTGSLQLFSLHEAHGDYQPPALIEKLSSVHKDQVFAAHKPDEHDQAPAAAGSPPPARPHHGGGGGRHGPTLATVALKWFFLVVALGLATSTGLGLWIGLSSPRRRRIPLLLLAAGTVIPLALVLL